MPEHVMLQAELLQDQCAHLIVDTLQNITWIFWVCFLAYNHGNFMQT